MKIDLSRFRDETISSIPIRGETEMQDLDIRGRKIKFFEPIKYDGEIFRIEGEKLLYLSIAYSYNEACGRCLESFANKEEIDLRAKLVDKADKDIVDDDEYEDIIYYIGDEIDLQEYIINTVILSLPMKPLCSEECKGLCPKCGANHNQTKCDCVIEDIDPRFQKLKNFFPDD